MRILSVIMLAFTLSLSARTASQTITFKGNNIPLNQLLVEIEKQTGYFVVYSKEEVLAAKPVSVAANQLPVNEFIAAILKGQPFQFSIEANTVFIQKKNMAVSPRPEFVSAPPVTGIIRDNNGNPLQGVNVVIKGTRRGVTTDANGNFSIESDNKDVLVISAIGFSAKEIKISDANVPLIVALEKAVSQLDEVKYIAYGTTSQRFSVGNVTTVKAEDIEKAPVTNPLLALQGRVPGLFITQTTGLANGHVKIRIQGQNSIREDGNEPLIVIDGVPYPAVLPNDISSPINAGNVLLGGSPLSFINPADIESISVLKDADATAIYGSRAANGAILIITKKGKSGKMRIDVNLQQGWGNVPKRVEMLNTRQYLDMRYEALKNDGIDLSTVSPTSSRYTDLKQWDTTRFTDWQKALINETALYSNINLSLSGGTDNMRYIIGGTYNRNTDIFPGDLANKRGSMHFSLSNQSVNRKFKIQVGGSYLVDNNLLPGVDLTATAVFMEPVAPSLYNADGSLNSYFISADGVVTWENPLIPIFLKNYEHSTKNTLGNAQLSYTILPGLDIKSDFGYSNLQTDAYTGTPLEAIRPDQRDFTQRNSAFSYRTSTSWVIEPQLLYNKQLGGLHLDALIGTTIQQSKSKSILIGSTGYNSDLLLNNIAYATNLTGATSSTPYKYNAAFARLNLNWDNKYILSLNARRDGSSRFGEKNRFHNFGSVGLAWLFSEESFVKDRISFLNFGKLRASAGITGNDQIGDYAYVSTYFNYFTPVPYQTISSISAGGVANPYIQWEETKKLQFGMELGFLQERLLVNVTYGLNRSSNQLLAYQLPDITGHTAIFSNFPATVQNTSWEISLTSNNVKNRDFSWNTTFNFTFPRNKLVAFPNIENSTYATGNDGVIVGQPLGVIKAYKYIGVDSETGLYLVEDMHGNATSMPSYETDRIERISLQPRYFGGMENSIGYKNFKVSFLIQAVRQSGPEVLPYNSLIQPGSFARGISNQSVLVSDRWRKQGDIASVAKFNSDRTLIPWILGSDAGYSYDASYIRIKNVSISWDMPGRWLQAADLINGQLYFQGQNLYSITKFSGLDPESQSISSLPPLRMWVLGIKLGF